MYFRLVIFLPTCLEVRSSVRPPRLQFFLKKVFNYRSICLTDTRLLRFSVSFKGTFGKMCLLRNLFILSKWSKCYFLIFIVNVGIKYYTLFSLMLLVLLFLFIFLICLTSGLSILSKNQQLPLFIYSNISFQLLFLLFLLIPSYSSFKI